MALRGAGAISECAGACPPLWLPCWPAVCRTRLSQPCLGNSMLVGAGKPRRDDIWHEMCWREKCQPPSSPSACEIIMTISDSPPLYASSIDALNALLQGEVAAEETYREAAAKVDDERSPNIHDNWDCHANRIPVLTRRITELGGTPSSSPGMWGSVERLTERGADMFSKDDVVLALESGEEQGLKNYRAAMQDLDPVSQQLVRKDLLPAQERTHRVMHSMKHASPVDPQHPQA